MKDHTKNANDWLEDNNVLIYNRCFEYKGHSFSIEKFGNKYTASMIRLKSDTKHGQLNEWQSIGLA